VNPSSGNLHPTEFHFCTKGLVDWPDGLYHYRPSSHVAEQRAIGDFGGNLVEGSVPLIFVLTSIAWREAWKYHNRAYRYCLHDVGHAWQALTLAARSIGCESFAIGHFSDDRIAECCLLSRDEWPMLIVELRGLSIPMRMLDKVETILFGGSPTGCRTSKYLFQRLKESTPPRSAALRPPFPLSASQRHSGAAKSACRLICPQAPTSAKWFVTDDPLLTLEVGTSRFRSCNLRLSSLSTKRPLFADFATARFVHLYLYVHRVEGLSPGVYRYWPEHSELKKIKEGDQRLVAAALSLGQDLAGNACLAISMIGDFENAAHIYGDRAYRYVHFEAGAIGQRMYLASGAWSEPRHRSVLMGMLSDCPLTGQVLPFQSAWFAFTLEA
jgi:SagB-type dehydrogenase family enzyme